ncbi:hypothetical protein MBLNU457_4583t2 [Dothideomycetes sp. NU457]
MAAQPRGTITTQHRFFADSRPPPVVLPGSQSQSTTDIPPIPKPPVSPVEVDAPPMARDNIPLMPPSPESVQPKLPPTGTGTASVASLPPPQPKRKPRRFRRFLTSFLIISTLGYAGSVYYSLVNDNFHDFFTEYVPFAEDAVAYFEERNFQKRFPPRPVEINQYPQIRGENKITIGKSSGVSPKVYEVKPESKGRHNSALEENKATAQQAPSSASQKENVAAVEQAKKDSGKPAEKPKGDTSKTQAAPSTSAPSTPAPVSAATKASLVDHVSVPNATEPVVQAAVKMVNDIITVINNDPNAVKYETTLGSAKSQLNQIISEIGTLKSQITQDAETKISNAHKEFDTAAKELVNRLEKEMQTQELHWREEYETEREKLAQSYQTKLAAELDVARKVAEQQTKNQLLEQEISLQRRFAEQVAEKVEAERNGRLSKLNELSSSVSELEKLTGEWNSVIDANLATQHLHVALESVRAAIGKYDHPTPFINELAALKEMGNNNEVINAAIASIPPVAYQRGVPTSAHLIDRFRRVASEVRKAALLPEDAGVASHAASAVLSRFMFSKRGEGMPEGSDVEAVLTRTEVLLEEGDLDGAAREMNGLHGWASVLSRDWVQECRRVLETKQALDVIATEARLQSLLVD